MMVYADAPRLSLFPSRAAAPRTALYFGGLPPPKFSVLVARKPLPFFLRSLVARLRASPCSPLSSLLSLPPFSPLIAVPLHIGTSINRATRIEGYSHEAYPYICVVLYRGTPI